MALFSEALINHIAMTGPIAAIMMTGSVYAAKGSTRAETRETAVAFSSDHCMEEKAPSSPQVNYAEQGYDVALGWLGSLMGMIDVALSILRPLKQFIPVTGLTPLSQTYQGARDTSNYVRWFRRVTPSFSVDHDPVDEFDGSGFESQAWDINMMCDEEVETIADGGWFSGLGDRLAAFANEQITSQVDQRISYLFSLLRGATAQQWALARSRLDIASGGLMTGVLGFINQSGLSECINIPTFGQSTAFMGEAENRCRGLVAGWLTGFIGF